MKPSRLRDHLNAIHADKRDKPIEYFKSLRDQHNKRLTIPALFQKRNDAAEDGLIASYRIAELIAKNGKPHNIGEKLILPALREVISTVMHQNPADVIKALPLSDTSIQRRIDEMATDVEAQLIAKLQNRKFSLQLDESTLPDNTALLMAYVRYFDDDGTIQEEMLFANKLITDTKEIQEILYRKFNDVNLQLQGKKVTLIDCKKAISSFIDKLDLYRKNLLRKEFYQFPELSRVQHISTEEIECFGEHLRSVKIDMETRFRDLLQLKVASWMVDPFLGSNTFDVDIDCQEEILELRNDEECRAHFNSGGYMQLWQRPQMPTL